jgi:hypothetical protein
VKQIKPAVKFPEKSAQTPNTIQMRSRTENLHCTATPKQNTSRAAQPATVKEGLR